MYYLTLTVKPIKLYISINIFNIHKLFFCYLNVKPMLPTTFFYAFRIQNPVIHIKI